jgi:hypothetical protein
LKIGRYAIAIAFLGVAMAQPGFAKVFHGHRGATARSAAAKPAKAKETHTGGAVTGASPEAPVAGVPQRPASVAEKSPIGRPKFGEPERSHVRPVSGATAPIVRNAIGIPIARREGTMVGNGVHTGNTVELPRSSSASVGRAEPLAGAASPLGVHQGPQPTATASVASRGRIDGAALIRPALAPSGLGGPAKVAGGINGTAIRPKH